VPDAVWVCRTGNWEVELHFSAIFYAHLESHTEPRIRGRRTPSAAVSKAMQAKIKNQRSEEWLENKRLNNFFFFLTQRENGNGIVWKILGKRNWVKQMPRTRTTVRIMNINKCFAALLLRLVLPINSLKTDRQDSLRGQKL